MNTSIHVGARRLAFTFITVAMGTTALADPVTGLTTFTAGTPARATEVNGNFTAVKTAVDDNFQRITAMQTQLAQVQAQLANPQVQALLAIAPFVTLQNVNGQPTIRITHANLQIVNGEDNTDVTNGTGNLIVGYNEARPDTEALECSVGFDTVGGIPVRSQPECVALGGAWGLNHRSGSHNVVIGARHNYPAAGTLLAGYQNSAMSNGSSVPGGLYNHATSLYAAVVGGYANWAYHQASVVSGGSSNEALGVLSSISGGIDNTTSGFNSSVSGGRDNNAAGDDSSVSGGRFNIASGTAASVSGGSQNNASGNNSSVLGGASQNNNALNGTTPALP
jgi:hypothetical protein